MFRGCFLREAALFGSVSEFHLFEADTGADFDRLLYTPLGGCGKMDGGKMEERVQNTIQKKTGSEIRCIGSVFCSVFWSYGPTL